MGIGASRKTKCPHTARWKSSRFCDTGNHPQKWLGSNPTLTGQLGILSTLGKNSMTTKLCFFGPMIGKYEGQITTQEFLISSLLRSDVRYEITAVSSSLNRYVRLFEMSFTTIRLNRSIDIGIISVY